MRSLVKILLCMRTYMIFQIIHTFACLCVCVCCNFYVCVCVCVYICVCDVYIIMWTYSKIAGSNNCAAYQGEE